MIEIDPIWQPFDLDIEKIIIGSFIVNSITVNEFLSQCFKDLFYSEQHKVIFEVIEHLQSKSIQIDLLSVRKRLEEIERLDFIGGNLALFNITDVFSSRIEYYITVLKELYIKRRIVIIGQKFISEGHNPTVDVFDTLAMVDTMLSEINQNIIGNDYIFNLKSESERVYTYMTSPKSERHTGIKTGNGSLTSLIGGWNPGELYYLIARPGMGKTTRLIQFILNAAFEGNKVDFYSLEMSRDEILKKMFLNVSDVESEIIDSQSWSKEQIESYFKAHERVKFSNIYIDDRGSIKPKSLRTISHQRKPDIICIDYLQLMDSDMNYKGNREREVGSISMSLKKLAKELKIPIIALVQLSRECEKRDNKRPRESDMRDSGQLEQDADVVLSLFSPVKYNSFNHIEDEYKNLTEDEYKDISELTVLKNRNGQPGVRIIERFLRNKSKFI